MTTHVLFRALRVALLTSLLWATHPTFASDGVGADTPASCTEAALRRILR
jgi:hypothetical protein